MRSYHILLKVPSEKSYYILNLKLHPLLSQAPHCCEGGHFSISKKLIIFSPGEVITVLRILNYISGTHLEEDLEEYKQLKYKYVILQLYSLDGIPLLTSILGKLVSHYEQAFMHLFTNSFSLTTVISLCVRLLAKMLHYVIKARGPEYKDLTCVETLLNIHTLCYYITPSSNG